MKSQIAISCLSVLFALFLVEAGIRYLAQEGGRAPRPDRPQRYYVAPDHRSELDLIEKQPKSDAFRIAVVGDSFTFGPSLQADDTYAKHLERLLNLQPGARPIEVFNLGIPGYSTHHEVDSVRAALRAKADLVVLSITLNDPQLVSLQLETDEVWRSFGKYRPSSMAQRVFEFWRTAGFIAERFHNSQSVHAYIEYHQNLFQDPLSWGRFSSAVQKIRSETEGNNVPLYVIVFPLFDFPLDKNYPFLNIHKKVDQFLSSARIPHTDLFSAFRRMDNARLQIVPGKDSHPNEIAHRIAGERLFAALLSANLVPASSRPGYFYSHRDDPRSMQVHPLTAGVQASKGRT